MASTISVIIPTFNRAALLTQTLNSVLAQTRPPDEIIVVDDGSTDDTADVVASYGPRVRYQYQTNAYQAAARNKGQSLATGDYLAFLDSDDLWLPDALAELETALEAAPRAVVAYCRAQIVDGAGNVVESLFKPFSPEGDVWKPLIVENFLLSTGPALIRRTALDKTGPWDSDLRGVEDWDMFLRLAEQGPFVCVPEPLFQYRFHGSNMSSLKEIMQVSTNRKVVKLFRRHWAQPSRFWFLAANYTHKSLERAVRRKRV